MTELAEKHCVPCEGGIQPLTREEAERYLKKIAPDWELTADAREIRKDFKFKGFNGTMGFVNAVAWIANRESHHPDLEVGYNRCVVHWSTHDVGGLSMNDFICAARVEAIAHG